MQCSWLLQVGPGGGGGGGGGGGNTAIAHPFADEAKLVQMSSKCSNPLTDKLFFSGGL